MDVIAIRFQKDILKKINKAVSNHNFNSRTELIREAVRDKLEELKKSQARLEELRERKEDNTNDIKQYSL